MNVKCDHIGLFSQNPDILVPFYKEKLGFEHKGTRPISKEWMTRIFGLSAECQLIKMCHGSLVLEIFVPQSGELGSKITPSAGYNHWGLGVEDKELFVHELESNGVSVLKLKGTGRFTCFVKDPEGNLIEIYEK